MEKDYSFRSSLLLITGNVLISRIAVSSALDGYSKLPTVKKNRHFLWSVCSVLPGTRAYLPN